MAKICTVCGAPLKDGVKFCEFCGSPVPADPVPEPVTPEEPKAAFCPSCGQPYVMPPASDIDDPAAWASARRHELAEFTSLL